MRYGALRALRTHAHCTRTYGSPEGSFPSGKKQRRICAAAMSGSAWTGVIMGGPSRKHSNLSGNKQNDSEARGKCGFERIIPKTRSKGRKRADRCGRVVIGRFRRKLGGSPSGVTMGRVRRIQVVIAEKSGHWRIPSVLSGNKRISRENWRISAALSGLIR